MTTSGWVFVVGYVVSIAALWLLWLRRADRAIQEAEERHRQAKAQWAETLKRMTDQQEDIAQKWPLYGRALEKAERQAKAYFDLIDSVCAERDKFNRLYTRMSIEHANAQGLLMMQIQNLGMQILRLTKRRPVIDPNVERAVTEFYDAHLPGEKPPVLSPEIAPPRAKGGESEGGYMDISEDKS